MSVVFPRLLPLGDRGLIIELGETLSPEINGRVRALAQRLRDVPGVDEAIPTLRSVLIVFDPLVADVGRVVEAVDELALVAPEDRDDGMRVIEIPVVYGGEAGPDLEEVASLCALTPAQFVGAHHEREYTVYMVGFTPGYPYLGILPPSLHVPRLPVPRLRVPVGSVAIADAMTGIYPLASAGGWRLIGRTPRSIYDPRRDDPVLLRPGDRVRFVPVSHASFAKTTDAGPLPVPSHPVLAVVSPGLYTTVQDLGRPGHRWLGIPASGAMDPLALQVANIAAGNPPHAPALEITAPGPVLRVLDDCRIAVAGADLSCAVDGVAVAPGSVVALRGGRTVEFGAPRAGMWAYLALAGGFDVPIILGSASTYVPGSLGGHGGRRLREGDLLGTRQPAKTGRGQDVPQVSLPDGQVTVRVIPGPQDDWVSDETRTTFLREPYRITPQGDRSGMRLDGRTLTHRRATAEFLSDGVLPGAVQVPSGGQPIVIMPDGPTTGGYPKIASVISADLRLVAQSPPGTRVSFRASSMEAAVDALRRERALLRELQQG